MERRGAMIKHIDEQIRRRFSKYLFLAMISEHEPNETFSTVVSRDEQFTWIDHVSRFACKRETHFFPRRIETKTLEQQHRLILIEYLAIVSRCPTSSVIKTSSSLLFILVTSLVAFMRTVNIARPRRSTPPMGELGTFCRVVSFRSFVRSIDDDDKPDDRPKKRTQHGKTKASRSPLPNYH
jgi:hypothetical protein